MTAGAGGLTSRASSARSRPSGATAAAADRRPSARLVALRRASASSGASSARSTVVAASASPLTQRSAAAPKARTRLKSSRANDSPRAAPISAARSPAAPHSAATTPAAAPVAAAASMANRRLSEFDLTSPGAMAALLRQPTVDQPTQTTYRGATGELSPAANEVHSLQLTDPAKSELGRRINSLRSTLHPKSQHAPGL